MSEPRLTRLDNGVHVLSHTMAGLETVALGVWVGAGARDESQAEAGIAHLIEHMAFKGTPTRSARAIAETIEAAGGEINAATSMETTAYHARVLADDWPLALEVLADILVNPLFEDDELDREKQVVVQEIAAARDTPDDLVFDLAQKAAFADHPLGRDILGEPDRVAGFSAGQLRAFRLANYHGQRMVVAAAGRIDHDRLVARTRDLIADVPAGAPARWSPATFVGGPASVERPLDQTHLVLAFPAPGYRDDDIYALQVYAGLLGGGMSSRLFQDARERRGLCYSIFSYPSAFRDCGLFSVYAAGAPASAGELSEVICRNLVDAAENPTDDELARARAQLKAGLVMSLESATARADQIARQFLAHGRVTPIGEIIARIDAVGREDVRRVAARVLAGVAPAFAAVGVLHGLPDYDTIAARFA